MTHPPSPEICEHCEHLLDLAEGDHGIDPDYWAAMGRWHKADHRGQFWSDDGAALL